MITAHGLTHQGHVRPINEDAFASEPGIGLFIVCDGMGGHNAGEVASSLAVDAIRTFIVRTHGGGDVTWPYGIDRSLSFEANRVATAIRLANRRVFKLAEHREDYSGMGTTAVVALIADDRLVIGSVGDSRAYTWSDGRLEQLTEDESWVAQMVALGKAEAGSVSTHPMKHILTNVVGVREQIDVRVTERMLRPEEMLLLSSDGLHGAIGDDAIGAALGCGNAPDVAVKLLVQQALDGKAEDNITGIVIRYCRGER